MLSETGFTINTWIAVGWLSVAAIYVFYAVIKDILPSKGNESDH